MINKMIINTFLSLYVYLNDWWSYLWSFFGYYTSETKMRRLAIYDLDRNLITNPKNNNYYYQS